MSPSRRQFLTLMGGSAAGAVVFQACGVPEEELLVQSPVEMPEDLVTGLDNWYATLCRRCPSSEGIVVRILEGRAKKVEGNVDYPLNMGRHSARCEAGLQALYHPDRIGGPLLRTGNRGSGLFDEISWPDAIARLTSKLSQLQAGKRQSSMVMVTEPVSAHLGMVIERFVSRFGGWHMPYEALERTTLRAAMKRVFNQDVMPDFDIENSRFVLSFGADFLNTWVSPVRYARGYGVFRQGDRERGKLVHVDSRFSMTAANADEWFHVKPGMEGVLALSLAQVIISEGLGDPGAAAALTASSPTWLNAFSPEAVAGIVSDAFSVDQVAEKIRRLAREFAGQRPALALAGGSAAAHTNGMFNLVSIYSLNYLVGSVGEKGGVVFNPKPPLDDIPTAPSATSFENWRRLVDGMRRGEVQIMMVRDADPLYGLPSSVGFKDAAFDVPLIVSFSEIMDDTTSYADLILPGHNYLEDWGSDVADPGPGYQLIGFQQPVVRPFFESRGIHLGTRGFADVLLTVAQGLGLELDLPGENLLGIVRDGARRLFETGRGSVGVTPSSSFSSFEAFWNGALQHGFWRDESAKSTDRAPTPDPLPETVEQPRFDPPDQGGYPFHLAPFLSTSFGDGRGAALPWLQATPDPISTGTWRTWVEINVETAKEKGIEEGDVVRVSSAHGSIEAMAFPHPGMPPDVVSVPIGQGHSAGGRYAQGRGGNVLSILAPMSEDSTQALAWAATRVKIEKTGRWMRLPKFENSVPELPEDEEGQIIQLTHLVGVPGDSPDTTRVGRWEKGA